MGANHSHSHDHGPTWSDTGVVREMRWIVGALVAVALATLVGFVLLWPDGSARAATLERAVDAGLPTERFPAEVVGVTETLCNFDPPADPSLVCRSVEVIPEAGPQLDTIIVLDFILDPSRVAPSAQVGEKVILGRTAESGFTFFLDDDRRMPLVLLALLFAAVVVAFSRKRGLLALGSTALTVAVLALFVAPSVLAGNDPLLVCVVAASAIGFITLLLTHGFNPTTTVALFGVFSALGLTLAVASVFFKLGKFTGLTAEGGAIVPAVAESINLPALLLGGTIIGTIGALDDVTITQVATVNELRRADPSQSRPQLIAAGVRVGRSHIASTVNTLVLAYAGAAMPLLLVFDATRQSLGLAANTEAIALEIVRTLSGSIGLVAAVPLTTALAAGLVSQASLPSTVPTLHEHDDPTLETPPQWSDFAPEDPHNS